MKYSCKLVMKELLSSKGILAGKGMCKKSLRLTSINNSLSIVLINYDQGEQIEINLDSLLVSDLGHRFSFYFV